MTGDSAKWYFKQIGIFFPYETGSLGSSQLLALVPWLKVVRVEVFSSLVIRNGGLIPVTLALLENK